MSPILSVLLIVMVIAGIFWLLFGLHIVKGINNPKEKNRHTCYHTLKDCEDCMSAAECQQKTGEGLLYTKEDD